MPSHHRHLHKRAPAPNGWEDFTKDVAELNPFSDSKTLQGKANGPSTVYATVYTTLTPTFTGEIGGYSTQVSDDAQQTTTAAVQATTTKEAETEATEPTSTAAAATTEADDTELPESVVPTTTANLSSDTTLAIASSHSATSTKGSTATGITASAAVAAAASSSASSSATSTASSSTDSSSSGDNSGAKAGIAFGVLGGLLVFGLLAWFLFNKRRKQMQQQASDNEKINGAMGGAAVLDHRSSVQTTRTTATAPRLSLRPVTQFMPNFGERRSSKGAAMALAMGSANNHPQSRRPVAASPMDRPSTSQSNHQENPFGNNAERLDAVSERSVPAPGMDAQPVNPFNAPENVVGVAQTTDSPPGSSPIATAAAAGAGAIAGTALTRKQSTRRDAPHTLDLTKTNNAAHALGPVPSIPASPAGTEFSMTEVDPGQAPAPSSSAAAIAAAGGPPQSTVHRVQLDFNPTLDDEIGLKAGQLVRMLHEYDDGWALCIRLDRSQQGVCPRTCLSTRPVKPRPAGPPGARNGPPVNPNGQRGPPRGPGAGPGPRFPPGQRPMTPQGGPMAAGGRPQSPAMMRPQSPAGMPRPQSPAGMGRPQSPGPRAMSPGPRSQSPGPRQRGYSQSSASGPRNGPGPGPSRMNPANGVPPQQRGPPGPPGPPQGPIGRKPVPGQAY
ncbi:hypothetical protein AB5N19_10426 [Seiridium cardinale]|uniref:SH3 domain-containing protein n=1 Tax=Seiridium cardinale TaxID=138064 RepID=A0ABR2XXQ2_9PEZI